MPAPKPAEARKARRAKVLEMLCNGEPVGLIISELTDEFGVACSTIEKDLQIIRRETLPRLYPAADLQLALAEQIAKTERHFKRCIKKGTDGGNATAMTALKYVGELLGLSPAQNLKLGGEVTVNNGPLDAEQIDKIRQIYGLPALPGGDQEETEWQDEG